MSDSDKNDETLTPRHQLAILQRQIDKPRPTRPARHSSPPSSTGHQGRSCVSCI